MSKYSGQIEEDWTNKDGKKSRRIVESEQLTHLPLIKAFLKDEEIKEMTIVSANIGFTRTYRKFIKSEQDEAREFLMVGK